MVTHGNKRSFIEERIKAMYNDCAKAFNSYLSNHNMRQYNQAIEELCRKYDAAPDIKGLLFWWAGIVNGVHQEYERGKHEAEK